jgi:membrane protease YdiL (CAAX protease family)
MSSPDVEPRRSDLLRTQAAWRDFAIGLALFLVALRVLQSLPRFGMDALTALQALLVAVTLVGHAALYRLKRFTEVTGALSSFGRAGVSRLSVVGVAMLILVFSVSGIAQTIGGPIERPLPWDPRIFDRGVLPAGNLLAISFYAVVTAPIIEELCFRGWMQRGLGLRFNPAVALFIPALLWAALHAPMYSHPAYLSIPLVLGFALGLVAERSRSLWPPIVLHALWNLTMFALATRGAERRLFWGPPQNTLEIAAVGVQVVLSGMILLRGLPPAERSPDHAGLEAALDTEAAA